MSCFPYKSMGLRLDFPLTTVSTSWKFDLGFACPIERVIHKSKRPMVVLLQKLNSDIFDILLATLIMELWSHGLNSSNANLPLLNTNNKTTNDYKYDYEYSQFSNGTARVKSLVKLQSELWCDSVLVINY